MHKGAAPACIIVLVKHHHFPKQNEPRQVPGRLKMAKGVVQMKKLSHSAANKPTRARAVDVLRQQMLDVQILRKMVAEAEQLSAIPTRSTADNVGSYSSKRC